jgi:hypothetical protein
VIDLDKNELLFNTTGVGVCRIRTGDDSYCGFDEGVWECPWCEEMTCDYHLPHRCEKEIVERECGECGEDFVVKMGAPAWRDGTCNKCFWRKQDKNVGVLRKGQKVARR